MALGLLALLSACSKPSEPYLRGKVQRQTLGAAFKIPGRIAHLQVQEGQLVHQGDTLAVLDLPEALAKRAQAEGALFAASAQLQMAGKGATREQRLQADAALQAAKEQYAFAQSSHERVRKMYEAKMISEQKYEEVRTKLQLAQAQLKAAQAKRDEAYLPARHEQQDMARGQRMRAQGAIQEVEAALSERYLLAPADMSVEAVNMREGELAAVGYQVVSGYDRSRTEFRFAASEAQMKAYAMGDTVTMTSPFDASLRLPVRLVRLRELRDLGRRSGMAPGYALDEALYELIFEPLDAKAAAALLANTSVQIPLR